MSSLVTPDTSGSFHTCRGLFSRSLIFNDFYWISRVVRRTLLQGTSGAKHSPPGDTFQKSQGPPANWERLIFTKFPIVKSYPNEEFSIPITMIFNVDSNCVDPRLWFRALMVRHRHDFFKILKCLSKVTSRNQVFMKSREVKCHPWWFLTP